MKLVLGTAVLAAAVLAGCESTYNSQTASTPNNLSGTPTDWSAVSHVPGDYKHANPGEKYSLIGPTDEVSQDWQFASSAAVGGLFEVQSSQLALQKSTSNQIKGFAQKMVDDHTRANDQLKSIAQSKGITLPTSLDGRHQMMYDSLAKMDGANFDNEYIRQQEEAHRETVALFRSEQQSGSDPDLRNFAGQTLPTLQRHWDMVRDMQGSDRAR